MKKIDLNKFRINKSKVRKITKYALVVIIVLVAVILFPSTLSIYSSNASSEPVVDVAYSLLNVDKLDDVIRLDNMVPDDTVKTYSFSVMNYADDDESKLIDVNMRYFVELKTTTNLPIVYELYHIEDNGDETLIGSSNDEGSLITDDFGAKWVKIVSEKNNVSFNSVYKSNYVLKYSFSSEFKNSVYQDISDLIMIKIAAEQVV